MKLKPCPFCGGESEQPDLDTVYCGNGECLMHWHTLELDSLLWNTRPIEDKQAGEIARLKKKIKQWVCGVCEINEESECDHKTCEVFKTLKERQGE